MIYVKFAWRRAECWLTAHNFSGASGVAGVSGVCGRMDPKPDRLVTSGEIWVGGWWPGFDTWVRTYLVIINCQHHKPHVNNLQGMVDGKDWWQRP